MKTSIAIACIAAVVALGPVASACEPPKADCPEVPVGPDEIYYVCEDGSIWRETNGLTGLQKEAGYKAEIPGHFCAWAADERIGLPVSGSG